MGGGGLREERGGRGGWGETQGSREDAASWRQDREAQGGGKDGRNL